MRKPPWRGGFGVLLLVHDPRPPVNTSGTKIARRELLSVPWTRFYPKGGIDGKRQLSDNSWIVGIQRADQIIVALRRIAIP